MPIRTTAEEWTSFIRHPLPGVDSYPDEIRLVVRGVAMDDGAFDERSFVLLHPDEPVVVEEGVIFVDGHGIGLVDHFNDWRKANGIPTTTFVTLEVPDERIGRFMALLRKHGYADCIVDDQPVHDVQDNLPSP